MTINDTAAKTCNGNDIRYIKNIANARLDYVISYLEFLDMELDFQMNFLEEYDENIERSTTPGTAFKLAEIYDRSLMSIKDQYSYAKFVGDVLDPERVNVMKVVDNALRDGCYQDVVIELAKKIGLNPITYTDFGSSDETAVTKILYTEGLEPAWDEFRRLNAEC